MEAVELRSNLPVLGRLSDALAKPTDRIAHDRQLAHDVHQRVELANVDAHGLRDRTQGQLGGRRWLGRRDRLVVAGGRCGVFRRRPADLDGSRRRRPGHFGRCLGGRPRGLARAPSGHLLDAHVVGLQGCAQHVELLSRREQNIELDRVGVRAFTGRQIGDDLPVRLGGGLQTIQRLVDGGEREPDPQAIEKQPLLDVRPQTMLFVLGQDREQAGVEVVLSGRTSGGRFGLGIEELTEIAKELVDVGQRILAYALLDGENATVEVDAAKQHVHDLLAELELAEPQVIEQVFELVREGAHPSRAEEPSQALERMDRAEDVVDELGISAARGPPAVENEQIARQGFDDLVGFREELLPSLVAQLGHRSASCDRLRKDSLDRRDQPLRRKRLDEKLVRPERQPSIALGALARDDDRGGGPVPITLADELDQLESVDVGHVDVSDDEIVAATGQQSQSIEPARSFDNLDGTEPRPFGLESRANKGSRRCGIFDQQNPTHVSSSVASHHPQRASPLP